MAEMNHQTFEMFQKSLERIEMGQRDIKDSVKHTERKVAEIEITTVKQQGILDEHIRRTNAVEKLIDEVRKESKEGIKALKEELEGRDKKIVEELEEKLKPSADLHKTVSGFWTVAKWVLGTIITIGGATGAVIGIIKLFG